MDKKLELLSSSLKKFHISYDSYSIGEYAEEAICIERNGIGWKVYGGERGNKYGMKLHGDCKDACIDVISRVTENDDEEKRLTDFFNEECDKL